MVVVAEGGGETKGVMVSYHRLNFAVNFFKDFSFRKEKILQGKQNQFESNQGC